MNNLGLGLLKLGFRVTLRVRLRVRNRFRVGVRFMFLLSTLGI